MKDNNDLDSNYEEYVSMLDSEEKQKIKEIFDLFDKNLDGGIDIKELKFILNSLDIYPNQDELTSMMYEADRKNKGFINEQDFMFIIAKQKIDYRTKLVNDAKDVYIALGGTQDLQGKISFKKIEEILKGEMDLAVEIEKNLKKITNNKEEISFEEFVKFFQ